MIFRSKIDLWFLLVALGTPLISVVAVVATIGTPSSSAWFVILAVCLVSIGLPAWLIFSTRYVIDSGDLTVRSGPFRWSIPLHEIHSVRPSRSLLSSPALSLDRLEIRYGRGRTLLVSPKDKEGFQRALADT